MKNVLRLACVVLLAMSSASLASAQPAARDQLLLVVNREPQILSIFKANGPTLTPVKTLPIPKNSREISVSPDGNRAYVSSLEENSVTVVDLNKLVVVATITHPSLVTADGSDVSADSKTVYVTSTRKNAVVVIDAATNKVVNDIPTGREAPRRVRISPDGKKMYVGHNKSNELAVIDLAVAKVVSYIKVGNECRGGFAFTNDGKLLLNGAIEDDVMYCINPATDKVVRSLGIFHSPQRIEITPKGVTLVLCGGSKAIGMALQVIPDLQNHDGNMIIPIGKSPWGLALNGDGTVAFASNYADDTLSIIDLNALKVVQTMKIAKDPNGVAFRK
jgi:YVTN family beta-propeller protein